MMMMMMMIGCKLLFFPLCLFFLYFVFCPMRLNSTVMWTFGEIEMILFLFYYFFPLSGVISQKVEQMRSKSGPYCIVVDTTDSQMVGGGERWLDILNTTPTAETPELLPGGRQRTWASVKFEEKAESFALFWVPLNIVEDWGGHPLREMKCRKQITRNMRPIFLFSLCNFSFCARPVSVFWVFLPFIRCQILYTRIPVPEDKDYIPFLYGWMLP